MQALATVKQVVNKIIDIICREVMLRSNQNLGSLEFSARAPILASDVNSQEPHDKLSPRRWTTTNTGLTSKTGYIIEKKNELYGEVGYNAPWAYDLNFGSGPHPLPFEAIYEWAWKRRKEVIRDVPDLAEPRGDKDYWKLKDRFVKGRKVKTRAEKMVKGEVQSFDAERQYRIKLFKFAFYVWRSAQKYGIQPNFFFSDAVYTVWRDLPQLIKRGFANMEGVKVEY